MKQVKITKTINLIMPKETSIIDGSPIKIYIWLGTMILLLSVLIGGKII